MHDIDRTQLEWEQYEHDGGAREAYEASQEFEGEYGQVPLHEATEMELAAELLEVGNEAELEAFLGNVFSAVGRTLGRFARSDAGTALTGLVRNAARDALPMLGRAVGQQLSPNGGGAVGSRLAEQAGQLLGLELEGLSPQEQEFEAARQFVRFAGNAYANAASSPRDAHPVAAAQQAAAAAAERFAPGIARALAEAAQQGEFGRGYGGRRAPRGRVSYPPRRYARPRRGPQIAYGYPGYGGWAAYPYPVQVPADAPDSAPEEPGAPDASANGYEEAKEQQMSSYETESYEYGELGQETGEFEFEGESEFEFEGEGEGEYEYGEVAGPLHEVQEMELAAELLEITNEQELEQFLGKLFKGVSRAVGGFMRGPIGSALGGALKGIAKTALPMVGGALGSFIAPGIGTALGSKLGSMAGGMFELELEGMDREQAEFEVARRYVKLAADAAKTAALAPPNAPPQQVAQQAITQAAQLYAPGLVRGNGNGSAMAAAPGGYGGYPGTHPRPRSGRWVRRGRKIIVLGV